jgi:hypothetical protein
MMSRQDKINELIRTTSDRSVGRPRTIDDEGVRKLVDLFSNGHTVATACRLSGIPRSTYYNELARNEVFSDIMTASQDLLTWRATQIVTHSIMGHNLDTAKWWIDRNDRLKFHAQREREYQAKKKLTVKETYQHTQSVELEMEIDQ